MINRLSRPPVGRLTVGLPSLALGLVPLLVPDRVAGLTGLEADPVARRWVRGVGVRETVIALAFLIRPGRRRTLLFPAQDVMDLATLAFAAGRPGARRERIAVIAVGYLVLLVVDLVVARLRLRGES